MALPSEPLKAIFPIISVGTASPPYSFLGTGFFIGTGGTFMTAKHVLGDAPAPGGGTRLAAVDTRTGCAIHVIESTWMSPEYDVALGKVVGWPDPQVLELSDCDPTLNTDLITLEFSQTSLRRLPDGDLALDLVPSCRKGHEVRQNVSANLNLTPEPTHVLELSFPALRGASGAPVMAELRHPQPGAVLGLLIANVERHLLPAQIERIEEQTGFAEERRYFLPLGLAISWRHLREIAVEQQVIEAD